MSRIKGKKVHKTLNWKRKANKSRVKDRSRYPVVQQYEREFKYKFGDTIQDLSEYILGNAMKRLNVKDVNPDEK